MQKIIKKELCSGCHACFNACPKKCISMMPDTDGFLYPQINEAECVSCNKCKTVCPIINKNKTNSIGKAYACVNPDEKIRLESSSGGIFTLISEAIIEKDGTVFGAVFDDDFNVFHSAVNSKKDLCKLRGSKYVQSKIGDAYHRAKKLLDNEEWVLFTGTPCQINGLKKYLGNEYEKLITQDIVCHGVPSPKVWQKYIKYREKKSESQTQRVFFRNKKCGWKTYSVLFEFSNNTEYAEKFSGDLYMKAFLENLSLRPSCHSCHSKSLERESDITLADFWGSQNIVPDMDDDKGLSLVFVNSEKGRKLFEELSDKMEYEEVDIYEATRYNKSAYQSVARNKKRNKFFRKIENRSFDKVVIALTKSNILKRIILKTKRIIKRMWNYVQK